MKNENLTTAKNPNTGRVFVYSRMLAPAGLAVMILSAVFLLINNSETHRNQAASADLPALNGDAAVAHLKQNGAYDSLSAAFSAARYRIEKNETGGSAENEANNLRMNFTSGGGWQIKSTLKDRDWRSNWRLRSFGWCESDGGGGRQFRDERESG